ncbi:MAG: hypothetical protein [Podoviridae sp. ctLUJ1]|nr:MAG: hypothetical protein [Podoviridae sp. ctLUJ1]
MLEITRSVSIKIDEAGLKQLILDKVAAHDPDIVISSISFVSRRNPPTIEAIIDAHMEPIDANSKAEASKAVAETKTAKAQEDEWEDTDEEVSEDSSNDAEAPQTAEESKDPASAFLEAEEPDPFSEEVVETAPKKGVKGKPKAAAPETLAPAFEEDEEEEDPFL